MEAQDFVVGAWVKVVFNGRWYPGTVARVTAKRVFVTFTTGSGRTRTNPFGRPELAAGRIAHITPAEA